MQSDDVSTQSVEVQEGKRKRKVAQKAENNQEAENGKQKESAVHVKTKKTKVNKESITIENKVETAEDNQVVKNNGIKEKKNDKSKVSPAKNNTTKKNEKGKKKSLNTNMKQQEKAKEETKGKKKEKAVEKKVKKKIEKKVEKKVKNKEEEEKEKEEETNKKEEEEEEEENVKEQEEEEKEENEKEKEEKEEEKENEKKEVKNEKKRVKKEMKKEVKKVKKMKKIEQKTQDNVQEAEEDMKHEELAAKEEQGTKKKKKAQGEENNVKPKQKRNGKSKKTQQGTMTTDAKKKKTALDLTATWEDYEKIRSLAQKTNVYVGAHISAQGGVKNAPFNSFKVAGMAFALFLKNQRTWASTKLTEDNITEFGENCKTYKCDNNFIVPHAPYLINLASADTALREKSYDSFIDDLKRCELLNIKFYNIHPGSTTGNCSIEEGVQHIAECINKAHQETKNTIILLENEAGRANCVGSKFEQLRDIINQIVDKERIGVCLDTCHAFAAGYDIRTDEGFENTMQEFDKIINLKYLKAVHLNDSKGDLGCCKDRHENIGKGKLTIDTFKFIMNSKYFKNIPIILETPDDSNDSSVYKQEIAYMYSLAEL